MRNIREVLRLRLAAGLSIRPIRAGTKLSVGATQKRLVQAESLGRPWLICNEIKDICDAFGLDNYGREKQLLIDRILGSGEG